MTGRPWTPDDLATLRALADQETTAEIGARLGRSRHVIRLKARQLGLVTRVRFPKRNTAGLIGRTAAERTEIEARMSEVMDARQAMEARRPHPPVEVARSRYASVFAKRYIL